MFTLGSPLQGQGRGPTVYVLQTLVFPQNPKTMHSILLAIDRGQNAKPVLSALRTVANDKIVLGDAGFSGPMKRHGGRRILYVNFYKGDAEVPEVVRRIRDALAAIGGTLVNETGGSSAFGVYVPPKISDYPDTAASAIKFLHDQANKWIQKKLPTATATRDPQVRRTWMVEAKGLKVVVYLPGHSHYPDGDFEEIEGDDRPIPSEAEMVRSLNERDRRR